MLTQTLPTRDFILVLDSHCLDDLLTDPLNGALTLVSDLANLTPPVNIHLVLPVYLATADQSATVATGLLPVTPFTDEGAVPKLILSSDLRRRVRERIMRGAEGDCRGFHLLALADHLKADGVVTAIPSLAEPRIELFRHQQFRIVSAGEVPDFAEVCARGHGVPCTALPSAPAYLPGNTAYQFAHWKGRRLFNFFNRLSPSLSADEPLRELLRSALLNRYAFILRARDTVQFYRLQADRHVRHHGHNIPVFRDTLNYHLTAFYTHVWGMLDTLAQIANRRLDLGLDPFRCHINRDDFRDAIGNKHAGLHRFIQDQGGKWLPIIGDVRHPIAHAALRLQTDLRAETAESKKSDEEIAAILREEDPDFYKIFPPDLVKQWEPVAISNWRINSMKVVSDDVINVDKPDGGYFRQPVASIDFDVERVNAFVDAFLIACFGPAPAPANSSPAPVAQADD